MRDDLILNNLNLIYFVLKQMNLYEQRDYYYDLGLIGLVSAANKYDADKGTTFTTYAVSAIRNEILVDIRNSNMDKRKANNDVVSLDITVSDDERLTLLDSIPDSFDMEEYVIKKEQKELVRKAISRLNDTDKKLLKYVLSNMTQKDIATKLNITQPYVSRKIKKIINKIREEIFKEGY